MPLKLQNESAWRTRDIRSILLAGMRAHGMKDVSADVIADPPGTCVCRSFQAWRVRKERRPPGHVIVVSHLGAQELHGPSFAVHADRWTR